MHKNKHRYGQQTGQGRKPTDKDFDPFWELKNRYIRVKCGPNCSRNRRKRWTSSPVCAFALGAFTGMCLYLCFAAHYYKDVVLEQPYWPLSAPPFTPQSPSASIKEAHPATGIHEPMYGPFLPYPNQTGLVCLVISTFRADQYKTLFLLTRIRNTWGAHCTHLVASGFRRLDDMKLNHTIPTMDTLSTIYKSYGSNSSWFVIAPEKAYVCQENLALLVSKYNHSQPYQLGHAERVKNVTFISSTAGYILSNEALRRVGQAVHEEYPYCQGVDKNSDNFKKPLTFGICLKALGIELKDMRDAQGRLLFVPDSVSGLILDETGDLLDTKLTGNGVIDASLLDIMSLKNLTNRVNVKEKGEPLAVIGQGLKCCSPYAVIWGIDYRSFIFSPEYYLYQLNVFGVKKVSP